MLPTAAAVGSVGIGAGGLVPLAICSGSSDSARILPALHEGFALPPWGHNTGGSDALGGGGCHGGGSGIGASAGSSGGNSRAAGGRGPLHEGFACPIGTRTRRRRRNTEPGLSDGSGEDGAGEGEGCGATRGRSRTRRKGRRQAECVDRVGDVARLWGHPASAPDGRGIDVVGVRRALAAPVQAYSRGSLRAARRACATPKARALARASLEAGVWAPSSRGPRAARRRTIRRLLGDEAVPPAPVTVDTVITLAAALKTGRYRSGSLYLNTLKDWAVELGAAWTDQLHQAMRRARLSIERGLGAPRRALSVCLGAFRPLQVMSPPPIGQPLWAFEACVVGALWLLRGAELAALLGDQLSWSTGGRTATLHLAATNTDPQGRGSPRCLSCSCHQCPAFGGSEFALGSPDALCPTRALHAVMTRRRGASFGEKHPLFPSAAGSAASRQGMVAAIQGVLGDPRASEHSLRRSGAQFHARNGIGLREVQYLGRWGSATILRYIEEAEIDVYASGRHMSGRGGTLAGIGLEVRGGAAPAVSLPLRRSSRRLGGNTSPARAAAQCADSVRGDGVYDARMPMGGVQGGVASPAHAPRGVQCRASVAGGQGGEAPSAPVLVLCDSLQQGDIADSTPAGPLDSFPGVGAAGLWLQGGGDLPAPAGDCVAMLMVPQAGMQGGEAPQAPASAQCERSPCGDIADSTSAGPLGFLPGVGAAGLRLQGGGDLPAPAGDRMAMLTVPQAGVQGGEAPPAPAPVRVEVTQQGGAQIQAPAGSQCAGSLLPRIHRAVMCHPG